jgi:hypothetical protein
MRRSLLVVWIGLAGLTFPAAPAGADEPIEGRWSMGGGVVELRARGDGFESHWIRPRPGLLCPGIDDQDGDMRLEGSGRVYTGTWRWVLHRSDGSCEPIGRGPLTITVSEDGRTARLEADAPSGYSDHETHELMRPPEVAPSRLDELTQRELSAVPALVDPVELSSELDAVELAAVPRLQRLPFEGRTPFVR